MKKMVVWMMVLSMVVGLTGCGGTHSEGASAAGGQSRPPAAVVDDKKGPVATAVADEEKQPEAVVPEKDSGETTEKPEEPKAVGSAAQPASMTAQFSTWTSDLGYTFEGEFALSDWIRDEEVLTATWKSVAGEEEMPSFGKYMQVGGELPSGRYQNKFKCTDVVYAVGYFKITNKTDGFDISPSNPVDAIFNFNANTPYIAFAIPWSNRTNIYMAFKHLVNPIAENNIGSGDKDSIFSEEDMSLFWMAGMSSSVIDGNPPIVQMQSNQTGKVPFLVALGMTSFPKHPEIMPDPNRVIVQIMTWDYSEGRANVKPQTCDFDLQKTWE